MFSYPYGWVTLIPDSSQERANDIEFSQDEEDCTKDRKLSSMAQYQPSQILVSCKNFKDVNCFFYILQLKPRTILGNCDLRAEYLAYAQQ